MYFVLLPYGVDYGETLNYDDGTRYMGFFNNSCDPDNGREDLVVAQYDQSYQAGGQIEKRCLKFAANEGTAIVLLSQDYDLEQEDD